jgi:4-hydroxy-tetrahydrodipicolinate reductase
MAIRLCVAGATGRMGQAILGLAAKDPSFELVSALEQSTHPLLGKPLSICLTGLSSSKATLWSDPLEALSNAQVLIDFTAPSATLNHLKAACEKGVAMIIGTTGFKEEELAIIRDSAKKIPIVQSYNMSVGMNLLFALVEQAAAKLGTAYDVEIIEAHHKMKKDAPSGTAIRLGEGVARAWGKKLSDIAVHGREGISGERPSGVIGFHAVRGGDIVGDHTVLYAGPGERLELKHMVHSRETLAQGAIIAAKWLADKPAGLYDMWDVLDLKKG